jgi:hypothetical protein
MPDVGSQSLHPWYASLVAHCLHRLRDAARLNPHGTRRVIGRRATMWRVFDGEFEVCSKLFLYIVVTTPDAQRAEKTVKPFAEHAHILGPRYSARSEITGGIAAARRAGR